MIQIDGGTISTLQEITVPGLFRVNHLVFSGDGSLLFINGGIIYEFDENVGLYSYKRTDFSKNWITKMVVSHDFQTLVTLEASTKVEVYQRSEAGIYMLHQNMTTLHGFAYVIDISINSEGDLLYILGMSEGLQEYTIDNETGIFTETDFLNIEPGRPSFYIKTETIISTISYFGTGTYATFECTVPQCTTC